MLTQNDLAQKFRMVPGQVTITYTPMNPPGAAMTVAGARKRPLDGKEAAAFGITITLNTTTWILPAANMKAGYQPIAGDKITDAASNDWYVQPQGLSGLMEQEWKLVCTKGR